MSDTSPSSPSSPVISWPLERPSQPNGPQVLIPPANDLVPREYFPNGRRSLSGISIRAFLLGSALGALAMLSIAMAVMGKILWRMSAFGSLLCLFHFLEFWTTAYANTPSAVVSSFLLSNGNEYRIAHAAAIVEQAIATLIFPSWHAYFTHPAILVLGIILVGVGQGVRSFAMVQAGTNFNHKVQMKRNDGHTLVTGGIYSFSRHPAYFGFFWWGVGTQLMLGNPFCSVAYTAVLWKFFSRRIRTEERFLISFFPTDYPKYRASTPVLIPFIR